MNSGAKVFLALAGAVTVVGGIALLTTKNAKAAALPPKAEEKPIVIVPEHGDEAPPTIVPQLDVGAMNRLMLRWWSAEGAAFPVAELPSTTPRDFGSQAGDLGETWGPRQQAMAESFCFANCNDKTLKALKLAGTATPALLEALQRWAASVALQPAEQSSSPGEPAPMIIKDHNGGDVVVAPEPAPTPAPASPPPFVPPFVAPPPASPPPFVPPPAAPPVVSAVGPAPEPPPVIVPATLPPAPPALQQAAQSVLTGLEAALPAPLAQLLPVATLAPAPAMAVNAPSLVSTETANLVGQLLADEHGDGWKKKSGAVSAWQRARGLKQDQQFGPKTALAVAREIGTIPIVRYWPAGSQPSKAVPEYQRQLLDIAATAPEPRASQLRISAQREKGQGFGAKQSALPDFERVQITQVA